MVHSDNQGPSSVTNPAQPTNHRLYLCRTVLVLIAGGQPHRVDHQRYEIDAEVLAHLLRIAFHKPNEMLIALFIVVDVGLEGIPRKWEFVLAPLYFFAEQYFLAEHSLERCHDPHGESGLAL